jgi:regulatory protein
MEVKIIQVSKSEKRKDRYIIFISNGESYEIFSEVLLKFGLRSGDCIDIKVLENILTENDITKAKATALRLLAKKMRTMKEIIGKLQQKGFNENIIDYTIQELIRIGLINDEEFTEKYINNSIVLKKPYGKYALRYKLQNLGIQKDMIEEKLPTLLSDTTEYELAIYLARKKMALLSKYDKYKKKQKISSFLTGRGFDWDIIHKVFTELNFEEKEDE